MDYLKKLKNQNYTIKIRYKARKMIFNKKKSLFEKKLMESIGKPKDLWKALKSLGLHKKNFLM